MVVSLEILPLRMLDILLELLQRYEGSLYLRLTFAVRIFDFLRNSFGLKILISRNCRVPQIGRPRDQPFVCSAVVFSFWTEVVVEILIGFVVGETQCVRSTLGIRFLSISYQFEISLLISSN